MQRKIRPYAGRFAAAVATSVLVLLSAPRAEAFKIDTHVYVAQQVINDVLDDGRITLDIGQQTRSYVVDPRVVAAIRSYPAHFRMGAIGPDAFPGIISGQVVIHPGDKQHTGWGTAQWLRHIDQAAVEGEEIAFAKGYFVHAASDVFAHSYVNHYSGNVWDLTDETYVERRHFILESFIASKNPPIIDATGIDLGSAIKAVTHDGRLAIPASFLARTFIFNETAAGRFSAGAPHITFLHSQERAIADAEDVALRLATEIERLALYYYSGILLNNSDIQKLRKLLNDIRKAALPVDELKDLANEVTRIRVKFAEVPGDVVDGLLDTALDLHGKLTTERKKFEDAAQDLARNADQLRNELDGCKASVKLHNEACKTKRKITKLLPPPLNEVVEWVEELDPTCNELAQEAYRHALRACELKQSIVSLESHVEAARKVRDDIEAKVLDLEDDIKSVVADIEQIVITKIEYENTLLQAALDLVKVSQGDLNIVVAALKGWRNGVVRAGEQLTVANGQAIVNTLIANAEPLKPLTAWIECHWRTIAGAPYPVSDALCEAGDVRETVASRLKNIVKTLAKIDPVSKVIFDLIEDIERKVIEIVKDGVIRLLEEVTDQPVKELLSILKEPGSTQNVTRVFSAGAEYNLRAIPDAAYRVGAEMHLNNGRFDPHLYPVVYNAIVLSKLSMLNSSELNRLVRDAGVSGATGYGDELFVDSPVQGSNVLLGSVRSIDGSHQWFSRAMPFMRTWGHEHPPLGRYTYLRDWDVANGFRLWKDVQAKDAVFRRLFKGPLVAGIDAPSTLGFPPIHTDSYPYRVCAQRPFPDENDPASPDVMVDTTCPKISLAGILEANPDATKEDAKSLRAIHALLSDVALPRSTLAASNQWFCSSSDAASKSLNYWVFKFDDDGRFNARVQSAPAADVKKRTALALTNGDYTIVGDFLFTEPKGRGVIAPGKEAPMPTLVRRFTMHPQRYWIERPKDGRLNLWNQDGTKLYCSKDEYEPKQWVVARENN